MNARTKDEEIAELRAEVKRLRKLLNTPLFEDFTQAAKLEAAHQVWSGRADQDAEKGPGDWHRLIEHLTRKALQAHASGNREKALHHTISSAAALSHWHAAVLREMPRGQGENPAGGQTQDRGKNPG